MKKNGDYIAIIDYKLSNLYSVKHACDALALQSIITSNPLELLSAKAVILPGVGAFGDAMRNLKTLNLIGPMKKFIFSGRQFMGICLGMQLLFDISEEFGTHKGLGILKGEVVKFPSINNSGISVKVPQIGWNTIYGPNKNVYWKNTPLQKTQNHAYMYFVHSYYVRPKKKNIILSLTSYEGVEYCSSVIQNNVFATQFHPEKSGEGGISIYKYFFNHT